MLRTRTQMKLITLFVQYNPLTKLVLLRVWVHCFLDSQMVGSIDPSVFKQPIPKPFFIPFLLHQLLVEDSCILRKHARTFVPKQAPTYIIHDIIQMKNSDATISTREADLKVWYQTCNLKRLTMLKVAIHELKLRASESQTKIDCLMLTYS